MVDWHRTSVIHLSSETVLRDQNAGDGDLGDCNPHYEESEPTEDGSVEDIEEY